MKYFLFIFNGPYRYDTIRILEKKSLRHHVRLTPRDTLEFNYKKNKSILNHRVWKKNDVLK